MPFTAQLLFSYSFTRLLLPTPTRTRLTNPPPPALRVFPSCHHPTMPPKRGAKPGGSRGGPRAVSRTPGPRETTPSTKLSTSYGTPAPNTVSRTLNSGSASGALSHVLGSVNAANESAPVVNARAGRAAGAGLFRRYQSAEPAEVVQLNLDEERARVPRPNEGPGDSEDDSSSSDDPDVGDDRTRMPPPLRRPARTPAPDAGAFCKFFFSNRVQTTCLRE